MLIKYKSSRGRNMRLETNHIIFVEEDNDGDYFVRLVSGHGTTVSPEVMVQIDEAEFNREEREWELSDAAKRVGM